MAPTTGRRRTSTFFAPPGVDLAEPARELEAAASGVGATVTMPGKAYPDFRRLVVRRGDEACIVDLVVERAPMIEPEKARFGAVVVDTPREIAANKICTLLRRSEIKDLVDLDLLVRRGVDLERAFVDARRKDGAAEPATLAWVLDQIQIGPAARAPGGMSGAELSVFRDDLVKRLRRMAFDEASRR